MSAARDDLRDDLRDESAAERLDRNFEELLQELRVAQTGVQILFAFLLGLVFTTRFEELDRAEVGVYVAALLLSATAAGVLLAPVMHHRLLFRQRMKEHVVRATHRYAVAGLTLVLLALLGAVHLAVSLAIGEGTGWIVLALGVLLGGIWFVVPLVDRLRGDEREGRDPRSSRAAS